MPHISFIMAAYNAAPLIETAIGSALSQKGVTVEIIVVDDASTDRTAELVETIARDDNRVRLLRQSRNTGPAAARNLAVTHAKGDWLAVLDADDAISPGRTRHLLELAEITGADLIADNLIPFEDATGRSLPPAFPPGPADYAFLVMPPDYLRSNIPLSRGFATGYLKPMIRASFTRRFPLRYDDAVPIGEDFLFCLEALLHGARYIVSAEPHYSYRIKPGSQSHRLTCEQIDDLSRGFEALVERMDPGEDLAEAIGTYRLGLDRARAYLSMIDGLHQRAFTGSLRLAASRPDLWPLIARFGLEFTRKRLDKIGIVASVPR